MSLFPEAATGPALVARLIAFNPSGGFTNDKGEPVSIEAASKRIAAALAADAPTKKDAAPAALNTAKGGE